MTTADVLKPELGSNEGVSNVWTRRKMTAKSANNTMGISEEIRLLPLLMGDLSRSVCGKLFICAWRGKTAKLPESLDNFYHHHSESVIKARDTRSRDQHSRLDSHRRKAKQPPHCEEE
jgi:hypothetical protein